jgi:hypothetical protein
MVAAAFVAGLVNANVLVAYISLRTMLSPDAMLGRVGRDGPDVSVGLMPIGSLAAGLALTRGRGDDAALMGGARCDGLRSRVRTCVRARIPAPTQPVAATARASRSGRYAAR